ASTVQRTQLVQVFAAPSLRLLPADTLLCAGTTLRLRAMPQPAGTTYRWQDGSADSVLTVQQPGRYALEIRTPAGCTARDSVLIAARNCASDIPNIIIPASSSRNRTLVLGPLAPADWAITIYNRWGREIYRREHYDNSWAATGQAAGIYYYVVQNLATSYRIKGWVEVVK
ncbi:MAG: hypothetical protein EOO36_23135, partial [Cytophagaceae bacterium]